MFAVIFDSVPGEIRVQHKKDCVPDRVREFLSALFIAGQSIRAITGIANVDAKGLQPLDAFQTGY